MMTVSLQVNRLMMTFRISSAVVTEHRSTPVGAASAVGPGHQHHLRLRALAASARHTPSFPTTGWK